MECVDFKEDTGSEMDGCELSELDDVEWIWVESLLGVSACVMHMISSSN